MVGEILMVAFSTSILLSEDAELALLGVCGSNNLRFAARKLAATLDVDLHIRHVTMSLSGLRIVALLGIVALQEDASLTLLGRGESKVFGLAKRYLMAGLDVYLHIFGIVVRRVSARNASQAGEGHNSCCNYRSECERDLTGNSRNTCSTVHCLTPLIY
jgi:hypothetical protein